MPPADSTTPTPAPETPTSTPVPEAPKPKKVGFFARLFGKKPREDSVPAGHESQTPPAQLTEPGAPETPVSEPTLSADMTAPAASEMPAVPDNNPADEEPVLPAVEEPTVVAPGAPAADEGLATPSVPDAAVPSEDPANQTAPKL